jgi:glycerophosphoryl diester phosphodiesterase
LKVVAWTVNSREDVLRLFEVSIDGLASNIPGELVELRKELQLSK